MASRLWQVVAERVATEWNTNNNCMLVVGATYPKILEQVRTVAGDMTFLIPGVGAQGGDLETVIQAGQNSQNKGLMINSSRSIIFADKPASATEYLRDAINACRS